MEASDSLPSRPRGRVPGPVRGMESIVATVSGYSGSERFNLIRLISSMGASYVGAMSSSTTHLVCRRFEGRKYDLAWKFKTIVVNHRWVEDCIKQGERISEYPYTFQSGQEVGPLLLSVPSSCIADLSMKKHKVLSDQSNFSDESTRRMAASGFDDANNDIWIDSRLLKGYPELNQSSRRMLTGKRNVSGREDLRGSPSTSPDRRNIKSSNGSGNYLVSSSRKGRKLVKKNGEREMLKLTASGSDRECHVIGTNYIVENVTASSTHLHGEKHVRTEGTQNGSLGHQGITNYLVEDVDKIEDWNHQPVPRNSCARDLSGGLTNASKNDETEARKPEVESNDVGQTDYVVRLPTSMELSCVICWTEFSSTRGILPCGHRFCYSCILNWADHMTSRKKTSTCPLCKTSFVSVKKVEDSAGSEQKIYSQTIPHGESTPIIYVATDQEIPSSSAQSSVAQVCCECLSCEPVDLLISCHLCQIRCIHSYCLDPPLLPWTCVHCKDLQMLFHLP